MKRLTLVLSFLLSINSICRAQDNIDSLKSILKIQIDDTVKVNLLNKLSGALYHKSPEEGEEAWIQTQRLER